VTDEPLLRVAHGEPTDDELAAVVAVIAARLAAGSTTGSSAASARRRSEWADPARAVRLPLRPAPEGWRASVLPR
jgi:acyl-CoA carboxylase epsilon subunit